MTLRLRFVLPFGAILAVLLLWTGYWFYAKGQIRNDIEAWIFEQKAAGYTIHSDRIRISGYPYRFRITVTAPQVVTPESDGALDIRMNTLSAHALPYDFTHWIVEAEGPLVIQPTTGTAASATHIDAAHALISVNTNRQGETRRIGAEFDQVAISRTNGGSNDIRAIDQIRINGRVEEEDLLRIRAGFIGLATTETALSPQMQAAFGDTAQEIRFQVGITQWSALAREGDAANWTRAGGALEIENAALEWGPAQLTGTGQIALDSQARPDGRLSLNVSDPDALADALIAGGLVPEENAQALRLAAMMAPRGPDGVALPFRIRDGGVYLGPVRLGSLDD